MDRPDKVIAGLTWRQLVITTVTGLVLYAAWTATAGVLPAPVFLACATPVAAVGFLLAVGRRDGQPLDRWLAGAVWHLRRPRRLVPTTGKVAAVPGWSRGAAQAQATPPAPLRLPAKGLRADGLVDLDPDGTTALLAASTVAFGLRSPGEQNALVGGFARWLNSLDAPVQILIRAQRIDLGVLAARVRAVAPGLPDPALEDAAFAHAEFLDGLGRERELLHRQVTVAVRDTRGPEHTHRRAHDAVRALAGCEVTAIVLHAADAAAVLGGSLNPIPSTSTDDEGHRP
ncbi:MAG TPA: PrgI family protein [Pilimelia sp.]|nr:PrgI family protein [Pilimelia sp.]